MKIRFGCGMLLAMAFSTAGVVAATAQSGAVGEQASSTAVSSAASEAAVPSPDNGALPGDSHVRIVRLSEVKGTLQLDRKTGNGFEPTMPNMPIVQGEKLRTEQGYAEVEFEDSSTLRVTPNSLVEFPLLALRSSGAKASTVNVVRGMVYVNLQGTKDSEFLLEADGKKMTVAPSTRVRVTVDGGKTVVSVFNGSVEVQRGSETMLVTKKQSLTLGGDQMAVAKKIEEEPYDAWDKESNDYHARYSQANTFAGGGASYGLSDLNYYGGFINGGAFGSFWQPYFASAGWSPYGSGVWALYPGAGYSFVSPYPWGWLPYHSGAWSFFPGYGWGWQPGGSFNGLNNVVAGGGQTTGTLRTSSLPAPPAVGASLMVAGDRPMVFSQQDKAGNFVFQKDSAGLGVPRGTLGSLNKISNHVEQHGSASMQVYAAAPSTGAFTHSASTGPVTLRAGAPAPSVNSSSSFASREGFGGSAGATASSHSVAASAQASSSSGSSGGGGRGGSSPK
jgi:FecR protein